MPITYVGGQTGGFAGTTSAQSITFALTNGLASTPAAGDLVIVAYAVGSTLDMSLVIQTTGATAYTLMGSELYADDTYDTNLRVAYRFMPGTPESQVQLSELLGGTGDAANAGTYAIHVFRGVDTGTPMDTTVQTATGTNGHAANPPSITPVTSGAWVYAAGAGAMTTGAVFTSSDLTDFRSTRQNDTNDSVVGAGYSSTVTDPAAFGGGGSGTTADSWAALTAALRPASVSVTVSGVAATADAAVPTHTITAIVVQNATVASVAATADAASPTHSIAAQVSTTVSAIAATADAAVPAPTITIGGGAPTMLQVTLKQGGSTIKAWDAFEVTDTAITDYELTLTEAELDTITYPATDLTLEVVGDFSGYTSVRVYEIYLRAPAPAVVDANIVAVVASADAAAGVPTVAAQVSTVITAVAAESTATAEIPTAAAQRVVTVAGEIAVATAESATPAVTAVRIVTVAGEAATATAEVPAPTIQTGSVVNATIAAVPATVTAAAEVPALTAVRIVSIASVAATVDAEALAPVITVGAGSVVVSAVSATADAAAGTPTVTAARVVAITGAAATATAEVSAPSIVRSTSISAPAAEASAAVGTTTITAIGIVSITAVSATAVAAALLPTITAATAPAVLTPLRGVVTIEPYLQASVAITGYLEGEAAVHEYLEGTAEVGV